jgi:prepilin-type processing-associated H-X9-DG protein
VVLAIMALTLGLLLSGVMKVRAAAARAECANNLRQIGLGLHGHHDSQGVLPPGVSYLGGKSPHPFMSWLTRLLPFIDQDPLWRQTLAAYEADPFFLDNPPHVGVSTVVRVYTCPADGRTREPVHVGWPAPVACTDYLGVSGTSSPREDGVLFLDSRVRFADITDGLSNTLMVGERPPSANFILGWWYAGHGQAKDGSAEMLLGVRERNYGPGGPRCRLGPYHFKPGRDLNQCDTFHFWSHHPGGAHFLLADGSVSFFRYSADPILPALATRSGGEAASYD